MWIWWKYIKNNTENSRLLFGLAVLLGIQLITRIRNWKELKLFCPNTEDVYEHFNELSSGKID
ncbi:Tn3 family transposase [Bacillus cereus]|uniref:Tn3 family transposase n=1 Tax=Bacillus cereus TaxID=1396 RepID=UPI003A522D06